MTTTSYSLNASSIGVIGAGRLGTTLALALDARGGRVSWVASRNRARAEELSVGLAHAEAVTVEDLCAHASIVVLATPDDALRELSSRLPFRAQQAVVHCSGALELSALEGARVAGAALGCLHPIQTFPVRFGDASRFEGITIGVEASDAALRSWLREACTALGATPLDLSGVDRARYHAASVFASNYVIALHEAAARAFELAGLPRDAARGALAPLTLGAANALAELPLERALTGPLARGDVSTIERQLAALASEPALAELYRSLAARLLKLPLALGPADRAKLLAALGLPADDR
jgi:predicted short-subunit dehydrogenase-like oxidoreductase (DUF2520 family)